jgi:hypothetical protein
MAERERACALRRCRLRANNDMAYRFDDAGRPTRWEGGSIIYNSWGRPTFVIRKVVNGHRYFKRLKVLTLTEAQLEYLKFRKDPVRYLSGDDEDRGLFMDDVLIEEYLAYAARPRSGEGKENGPKWLAYKRRCLKWWAERLVDERGSPLDLRHVKRANHILPVLEGVPAKTEGGWKVPPAPGKRHKRIGLDPVRWTGSLRHQPQP